MKECKKTGAARQQKGWAGMAADQIKNGGKTITGLYMQLIKKRIRGLGQLNVWRAGKTAGSLGGARMGMKCMAARRAALLQRRTHTRPGTTYIRETQTQISRTQQ